MANTQSDDNDFHIHDDAPTLSRRQALHALGAFAVLAGSACSAEEAEPVMATGNAAATPPSTTSEAAASGGSSAPLMTAGHGTPPPAGVAASAGGAPGSSSTPAAAVSGGGTAGTAAAPTSAVTPAAPKSAGTAATAGTAGTATTGTAGSGGIAAPTRDALAALDCVATPEMTEGPFFVDEELDRSDLITGEDANVSSGLPLEIVLGVFSVAGDMCTPLIGAVVDIWHADIDGVYSDVDANFLQSTATKGKKFLRAFQVSDAGGIVRFKTIFPGWYGTRTVHIHLKIRGSGYELTTQLFFDEALNDKVMAEAPYNTRGERQVLNATDQVFKNTGPGAGPDTTPLPSGQKAPGEKTVFRCEPLAGGTGYAASLKIGLMMA